MIQSYQGGKKMHGRFATLFILLLMINFAYGKTQFTSYLSVVSQFSDAEQAYRQHIDREGSLQDSRGTLQIQQDFPNAWHLQANFQALAEEEYAVKLQQLAAVWRKDNLKLRLGKLAFPIGLFSQQLGFGYDLLWIRPPESFYSFHPFGPNVIHEHFTGAALAINTQGRMQWEPFFGHADLTNGRLKQILGLKLTSPINRQVVFEVAGLRGYSAIDSLGGLLDDDEAITSLNVGIQIELGRAMLLGEWAQLSFGPKPKNSEVFYLGLAYKFNHWQGYFFLEDWQTEAGWGEKANVLGFKNQISAQFAIKLEWKQIEPEAVPRPDGFGQGLFVADLSKDQAQLYSLALECKFESF